MAELGLELTTVLDETAMRALYPMSYGVIDAE